MWRLGKPPTITMRLTPWTLARAVVPAPPTRLLVGLVFARRNIDAAGLKLLGQIVCILDDFVRITVELNSDQPYGRKKCAENGALDKEVSVNHPVAHAELIATYRRAEADAAHKFGLIKAVATKGPKAIQAAVETAAKAAKRRDSYARKLAELGVNLKD